MAYIGKQPGTGVRNRFLYTATAGQTTFTTSDSNLALSYSDALYMDVYLNGVLLDPANDYTATSGTSIVLGSGASAGDILEVIVYDVFSVFNNTIDGNFTVGGDLTIDDKIVHAGDTNTAIRFPAADTVTIETAGSERVRVDSNGQLGIGVTSVDTALHVKSANDTVAIIESSDATSKLQIKDSDSTNGASLAVTNETLNIQVNGATRATISSAGKVGINDTSPTSKLDLGSDVGSSVTDVTNHIGLFGSLYGFGVTSNQLNYVSGHDHVFYNTSGTEQARIYNNGSMRTTTGLLFGSDTASANTLNDYEEGSWTATLSNASGTDPSSAVTATGTYTKIGDLVHIRVQMNNFNSTGASGAISITGLPYTGDVTVTASGDVMFLNCADHADNVVNVAVYVNNATIQFYQSVQDGAWSLVQHNAGSGRYLYFSATYKTTG
jgi:hypothetical protein